MRAIGALALAAGLLTFAPTQQTAMAADGDLDPTFGTSGKVTSAFGDGEAAITQPDGKIVMVGGKNIARYNENGTLDTTFGTAGTASTGTVDVVAVARQADGKIVAAGSGPGTNGNSVYVWRFDTNGTPDTSFATGGVVNIDFGSRSLAAAVAIDLEGRIMVAGSIVNGSQFEDFLVIRLTTSGAPDTTWSPPGSSTPGAVVTSVQNQEQDFAEGIAVQSDGKIVVVGSTKSGQFAMVRYLTIATLDTTFGAAGKVFIDNKVADATAVKIQPDGKIVVSASKSVQSPIASSPGSTNACTASTGAFCEYKRFWVGRFVPTNGGFDTSFGTNGEQTMPINEDGNDDEAHALALQADGKILVAGSADVTEYTYTNSGNQRNGATTFDFGLSRLNPNGSIDTTFGNGKVTTDFGSSDEARGLTIATNGRPVAVGRTGPNASGSFALARYSPQVNTPTPPVASTPTFVPLTPVRIMNTRGGAKVGNAAGTAAPYVLKVTGAGGVPTSGVGAVSINVTATNTEASVTGEGFVTVYPCDKPRPDASNLNFVAGQTIPNSVIAPVSANGEVCFYVYGTTHLLADVSGYFPTGAGFNPLTPARIMNTRAGAKVGNAAGTAAPFVLKVTGAGGVPATGVAAVVLNVTATNTEASVTGEGFVTVYPCDKPRPDASNLNFAAGQTIPNAVIAPVSANGEVCFYVYGTTHLLADVAGYIVTGARFNSLTPARIMNTRGGAKVGNAAGTAAPFVLKVTGAGGVPATGVTAVVLNVTATNTEASVTGEGFVTVYPCDKPRPDASNLNFVAGQTIPNAVIAPVSANGEVCFYVYGTTHLLADVAGYFF